MIDFGQQLPYGIESEIIGIALDQPVFDERAIDYLVQYIKQVRQEKGKDCMMLTSGAERSGKSTLAQKVGRKYAESRGRKFTLDSICFTKEEIRKAMAIGKIRDHFIFDEAGFSIYYLDWYDELNKELKKLLQIVGKKLLFFNMLAPHKDYVDSSIQLTRMHLWAYVFEDHEMGRCCEVRVGHPDRWKRYTWWTPLISFQFGKLDDDIWLGYEKRKDEFIESVQSGEYKFIASKRDTLWKGKLVQLVTHLYEKEGYSQGELAYMIGDDQSNISKMIIDAKKEVPK